MSAISCSSSSLDRVLIPAKCSRDIAARLQAKDEKKERKALRKVESNMMSQKARAFIQRLKQRAANKMIKGSSSKQKITNRKLPDGHANHMGIVAAHQIHGQFAAKRLKISGRSMAKVQRLNGGRGKYIDS